MNKATVKTFIKNHKGAIVKTGLAVTVVGGVALMCVLGRRHEARSWLQIIPWNETDKIAFFKKCHFG